MAGLDPQTGLFPATGGAVFGDFVDVKLDTFQRETSVRSGIVKDPKSLRPTGNPIISVITIIASAFIFITIVGWFAALQAYIDVKVANPTAHNSYLSRLYFAIITTFITFFAMIVLYALYKKYSVTH